MLKVSCISAEGDFAPGETASRLIWVLPEAPATQRPSRLLTALLDHEVKVVTITLEVAFGFPFRLGDLVLFDVETAKETAFLSVLQRAASSCSVMMRSGEDNVALHGFGIQFLDENEGPEVTKARILRALADRRESRPEELTVPGWRRSLVGQSRGIQKVAEIIRLVGPRRCTVLITGETGTGKEIVARAVHNAGPRAHLPFVALNCSAVPGSLMEAELFGHTRGAFTGASQARVGRIEQAEAGTLFLDEIGDLPQELQAKLLRVLQEREFQRLGSSETLKMNARVVAATNSDLKRKVARGEFREDLYYRLNVVPLELPPLRQRISDLRPLTNHFLVKVCEEERLERKDLTPNAWTLLEGYDWPGNVRQLENSIYSAVVLSGTQPFLDQSNFGVLTGSMVLEQSDARGPVELPEHGLDFTETVNALERDLLSQALKRTGGNKKAAAEILRMKRTTLSARVRVLDVGRGAA